MLSENNDTDISQNFPIEPSCQHRFRDTAGDTEKNLFPSLRNAVRNHFCLAGFAHRYHEESQFGKAPANVRS